MDPKKIIMDLNYRIASAKDDDPEKENAIRLRDRLLAKYGLRPEDLVEVREERKFDKLTDSEVSFVGQYFRRKLNVHFSEAPYSIECYRYRHKATAYNRFLTICLTDDEYNYHSKIVKGLVQIFRRKTKELAKKLRDEHERQMKALEYAIYDRAGILFPAGYGDGDDGSSYGLKEAMRAASELSDTIFPDLQIEQQFKMIEGGK